MENVIRIKGAREHNLKNIDIDIPRDKLTVITGPSGSGKSSLAFDTIYAEGQRRYVESLSAYARQFLEQMQKPDAESIEGLPPTISIEQRSGHATPRSIVATSTEIYDFLRLLFARVGRPFCYKCGKAITQQTPERIVDAILQLPKGAKILIHAPVIRGKKGSHKDVFDRIRRDGFVRVRVDGEVMDLKDVLTLNKNRKHEIDIVVDRLILNGEEIRRRLADSVEIALGAGEGIVTLSCESDDRKTEILYSTLYACPHCGISFGEIQPRLFSFNSPYGACPTCDGLGKRLELDADLIVSDKNASLKNGAIEAWRRCGRRMTIRYGRKLRRFCEVFGVNIHTPFSKIDDERRRILMEGTNDRDVERYGEDFEGVIPSLLRRFKMTESDFVKKRILSYMTEQSCPDCRGDRLRPEALSVKIGGKNICDVTTMTIEEAVRFFEELSLTKEERVIAKLILKDIRERLKFLSNVGLSYLTLDRESSTLSGGEAQRIRLASQVGSGLVGVCYVLDEPTIGLHQRDNLRLLDTLRRLKEIGNTVIVVEHDEDTIRRADHVVDIGPAAGVRGGEVVVAGTLQEVIDCERSLTGKYLSGKLAIPVPRSRRKGKPGRFLTISGARENNLKNLTVSFPMECFVCVTGVSGSGKSTLIHDIFYKALMKKLYRGKEKPGAHDKLTGIEHIDKVIVIDQSPIGRTPRSNPATYTGLFDEIRKHFAMTREAKERGYKPGRFSFNLRGGRCEACEGQGTKIIEMHFLPDVYVTCEECRGKRYNRETLEVKYSGKNIADVLGMSVEEAAIFFRNFPVISRILKTLDDVGLGYMALGQASTTLSGGEAQRIKLSAELGKASTGNTLYLLDEPTTGLHFADIHKLIDVLQRLVNMGNSVVVIEHNMHVIKTADCIVDLGPEGGERGGRLVAVGTPEEVAANDASHTGRFLREYLNGAANNGNAESGDRRQSTIVAV